MKEVRKMYDEDNYSIIVDNSMNTSTNQWEDQYKKGKWMVLFVLGFHGLLTLGAVLLNQIGLVGLVLEVLCMVFLYRGVVWLRYLYALNALYKIYLIYKVYRFFAPVFGLMMSSIFLGFAIPVAVGMYILCFNPSAKVFLNSQ